MENQCNLLEGSDVLIKFNNYIQAARANVAWVELSRRGQEFWLTPDETKALFVEIRNHLAPEDVSK